MGLGELERVGPCRWRETSAKLRRAEVCGWLNMFVELRLEKLQPRLKDGHETWTGRCWSFYGLVSQPWRRFRTCVLA